MKLFHLDLAVSQAHKLCNAVPKSKISEVNPRAEI